MFLLSIIALIDGIGFGIILPLLPIFAIKYDINSLDIAFIAAIYSFFQFITAPLLGIISDKTGRKNTIIISLLFISYSYHLLSNATTFITALISRAIAGSFSGNISVILASVSDITHEKNRYKYMGIISASYGLGFILGPIIGGFLSGNEVSSANLKLVFDTAAIFSLVAAIVAIFFLKETLIIKKARLNILTNTKRIITLIIYNKKMMFLIYLSILMWFAFAAINVYLNLWTIRTFDLSPQDLGIVISIFGLISVVSMLASHLFIQGGKAILLGFQISAFAMLVLIFSSNIKIVIIIIILLAVGIGILYPNLNSAVSFYGTKSQKGFILGLSQSAGMLGQTLGPLVVGFFYYIYSPNIAWFIIFLNLILAYIITLYYMLKNKKN